MGNRIVKNLHQSLCKSIRLLRTNQGWTQQHIANLLGVSVPAVSKIEIGITDISLSRMEQIADIFEIDLAQLLTMEHGQVKAMTISPLSAAKRKVAEREKEIVKLRGKIIELYEELQNQNSIMYKSKTRGSFQSQL